MRDPEAPTWKILAEGGIPLRGRAPAELDLTIDADELRRWNLELQEFSLVALGEGVGLVWEQNHLRRRGYHLVQGDDRVTPLFAIAKDILATTQLDHRVGKGVGTHAHPRITPDRTEESAPRL